VAKRADERRCDAPFPNYDNLYGIWQMEGRYLNERDNLKNLTWKGDNIKKES
jgi:hypothetical protein